MTLRSIHRYALKFGQKRNMHLMIVIFISILTLSKEKPAHRRPLLFPSGHFSFAPFSSHCFPLQNPCLQPRLFILQRLVRKITLCISLFSDCFAENCSLCCWFVSLVKGRVLPGTCSLCYFRKCWASCLELGVVSRVFFTNTERSVIRLESGVLSPVSNSI